MKIINEVIEFFKSKGLFEHGNLLTQGKKIVEEANETLVEIRLNELDRVKYELGDTLITCITTAEIMGTNIEECITIAHNKNINRTGKMIGSNYVKDSDNDSV